MRQVAGTYALWTCLLWGGSGLGGETEQKHEVDRTLPADVLVAVDDVVVAVIVAVVPVVSL